MWLSLHPVAARHLQQPLWGKGTFAIDTATELPQKQGLPSKATWIGIRPTIVTAPFQVQVCVHVLSACARKQLSEEAMLETGVFHPAHSVLGSSV